MTELIDWYKQYYSKRQISIEEQSDGFVSKVIFRVCCSNCKCITPMFEQRERYIGNQFIFYYNYNQTKYCKECGFQILYDHNELKEGE